MGCKRFFVKERKNDMFLNKIDLPYCLIVFFVVCPRLRPLPGPFTRRRKHAASLPKASAQQVCLFVTPFPSNFAEYKSNISSFSEFFGIPWSLTGY